MDASFRWHDEVTATGRLIGLARRDAPRAPMETLEAVRIGVEFGLEGDYRGRSKRQITILAREAWDAACAELGRELPWTTRRSNLLVEQLALPQRSGDVIAIGNIRLEVTDEVDPCSRMEEAAPGLRQALKPDWRGGIGCRVLQGGAIALGDPIRIEE